MLISSSTDSRLQPVYSLVAGIGLLCSIVVIVSCSSENPIKDDALNKTAEAKPTVSSAGDGVAKSGEVLAGIRPVEERVVAGDPMSVKFFIENNSSQDLKILIWNTPLEETLSADVLSVMRDGETLAYTGRKVRRGEPGGDDYVVLEAGDSVENEIELSRSYDVSGSGTYRISFSPSLDTSTQEYRIEDLVLTVSDSAATIIRQ